MRDGWPNVRLRDISSINYGYTAKAAFEIVGPKFLRITDIKEHGVDWSTVPSCLINDSDFEKHELQHNDIVFARTGATTGKSYRLNKPKNSVAASYLIRLRIHDKNVLPSFVQLFFQTAEYWDAVNKGTTGSAQGGFNASKLGELVICKPPLLEQKRIVAILDEAFEAIDVAIANTQQNLSSTQELFESFVRNLFEEKRAEWPIKIFGETASFVRGPFGGSLKKSCFVDDGIAVYEQQHAINDQFDHVRYFIDDQKFMEMKRFELFPNDLIMSCSGTMGKVAIVPQEAKRGIINQALLKISPIDDVLAKFLKFWMESEDFQDQISLHSKGAAIKNVASVKVLKEIEVPFPSISEQREVIESLNAASTETSHLEAIYQNKLDSLNELKQSLLAKAFSGELTAKSEKELKKAVG